MTRSARLRRIGRTLKYSDLLLNLSFNPVTWWRASARWEWDGHEDYLDAGLTLGPVRLTFYVRRPYRPNYN